jgi:tetratricopeptide (TPR) repeat protein
LTKDFGAATAAFSTVLLSDPANSKALCGLGLAKLGEGRSKAGIRYLKKALDADPENTTALNELISAAYNLDIFTDALSCTRAYLMYHPGNLDILFSLAGLLYKTGAYEEARDEVERLLALSPEYQGGEELLAKILTASVGNASPLLFTVPYSCPG